MKIIKLDIDKISYYNKDEIKITLDLSNPEIEKEKLTNININIYELGEKRNEFKFGFGSNPIIEKDKVRITQKLSDSLKNGIYFIRHIKFIYGNPENNDYKEISLLPKDNFELTFFYISHELNKRLTQFDIETRIEQISKERSIYRNKVLVSPSVLNSTNAKNFKVLIFGIGCLIHNSQELNGYTIYPIRSGINYSNLNNPVNDFLSKHLNTIIPFNEKIDGEFRKSTPLFVIDYSNVRAKDNNDALTFCRTYSERIFSILGYKKGQRPSLFAYVIKENETTNLFYNFQFPGYKGNIISEFSPTVTANDIDKLSPILNNDPWLKLIFDSYVFALNETNVDIKYFRLWAILELIAKKEITTNDIEIVDAEDNNIQNSGNNITTKYAVGKVYQYIYQCNFPQATCSSSILGYEYSVMFEMSTKMECPAGTEKVNLWELVNALYAIRNSTAHTGSFDINIAEEGNWKDKLAAKYYKLGFNMFLSQLETMVKNVIDKQIENRNNIA